MVVGFRRIVALSAVGLLTGCLATRDDYCAVRAALLDQDADGYASHAWKDDYADDGCDNGTIVATGDCDDHDPAIHPDAVEVCDDLDNDCDGVVDPEGAANPRTWYQDADRDTYGDPAVSVEACSQPVGFSDNADDCDDTDASLNPDTLWYGDADGDGFGSEEFKLTSCEEVSGAVRESGDCDDTEATTYPGADETCDGADDDCDEQIDESSAIDASMWWADDDEDGFGDPDDPTVSCDQPSGTVDNAEDCGLRRGGSRRVWIDG